MRVINDYLEDLATALHVRGRARRRILEECRDHLVDAAAESDEAAAVGAFGPALAIAAELDIEYATRRTLNATALTLVGVALTGGSTLALINATDSGLAGPDAWTAVFFIAAQLSGTAAALAAVQALAQRRGIPRAADLVLLSRRNLTALVAAGVTMFAAGAAVPGQASPVLLLAGPLVACAALLAVFRARRLSRTLDGAGRHPTRPPLADLESLVRFEVPQLGAASLLAAVTCLAAVAAFARDSAESASTSGAAITGASEAIAVVGCFLVFGRGLGLWGNTQTRQPSAPADAG